MIVKQWQTRPRLWHIEVMKELGILRFQVGNVLMKSGTFGKNSFPALPGLVPPI